MRDDMPRPQLCQVFYLLGLGPIARAELGGHDSGDDPTRGGSIAGPRSVSLHKPLDQVNDSSDRGANDREQKDD